MHSLHELVTTSFADSIDALCWPRTLTSNFGEVVEHLGSGEGIVTVDESYLQDLPLSDAGKTARAVLLEDQHLLRAFDVQPNLDCVHGSTREASKGVFTRMFTALLKLYGGEDDDGFLE